MKISDVQFPVFKPYKLSALEIYVAGCTNNCEDCINPELHDFDNGVEIDSTFFEYITSRIELFSVISILGGDLLCQKQSEAENFIIEIKKLIKEKNIMLWLFTGKDSLRGHEWIYKYFDIIKYGRYDKNLKQNGFPASSNQVIIKKGKDY